MSTDPEVEARRAADRERKKRALQKKKGAPAAGGAGRRSKGANEAEDANRAGAESKRDRAGKGGKEAEPSPKGWLRTMMESDATAESGTGRSVSQLRHLALRVLEIDGLATAQEILADPKATKTDKLRALDIVIKLGAGYMNPDLAGGEDVPDLPAPIFTTTDGQLPGEGIVTDENMSLGAEDDVTNDTAGPQLAGSPPGGSAPIPHVA